MTTEGSTEVSPSNTSKFDRDTLMNMSFKQIDDIFSPGRTTLKERDKLGGYPGPARPIRNRELEKEGLDPDGAHKAITHTEASWEPGSGTFEAIQLSTQILREKFESQYESKDGTKVDGWIDRMKKDGATPDFSLALSLAVTEEVMQTLQDHPNLVPAFASMHSVAGGAGLEIALQKSEVVVRELKDLQSQGVVTEDGVIAEEVNKLMQPLNFRGGPHGQMQSGMYEVMCLGRQAARNVMHLGGTAYVRHANEGLQSSASQFPSQQMSALMDELTEHLEKSESQTTGTVAAFFQQKQQDADKTINEAGGLRAAFATNDVTNKYDQKAKFLMAMAYQKWKPPAEQSAVKFSEAVPLWRELNGK